MDPITPTSDDAALDPTPAVAPTPAPAIDPAPSSAPAVPEAGDLGETESLLGAVMASRTAREADALRQALELDDAPPTAVPTDSEQERIDAFQRDAVLDDEQASADQADQFELHDAALGGDRIAQAAEDAARERAVRSDAQDALDVRAAADDARAIDDAADVDAATERLLLDEADADGASAARAAALDAGAAAAAVVARMRTDQEQQLTSDAATRERSQDADRAAESGRLQELRRTDADRAQREAARSDQLDRTGDELARERSLANADDLGTQLAGSAATTQNRAGRPPARIESRDAPSSAQERMRVDDMAPVASTTDGRSPGDRREGDADRRR